MHQILAVKRRNATIKLATSIATKYMEPFSKFGNKEV